MSKELHILSDFDMLEFVLAAFGDPNLSDMQQHIHTHISHDPLMGHRPQTAGIRVRRKKNKKYWFSVLLSDFLGTAVIVTLILLDLDWFGMTELVRRGNIWPTQTLHRWADVKISRISLVIWKNVSFIINLSVNFWTNKVVDAYSCLNLHTVDAFFLFFFKNNCQVFWMPNFDMQCWFAVAFELRLWMLEMGLP